ncbi:DUF624 domain-containing protein [Enterococcus sp. RIT-PI-f]|uniref:DUF624 domain-containing protein n=1 Tax=Enterococcus sp. RIT-PI-f TaxID=1690244 RepID=UPI0006B9B1BA|nr:DUF624 domain-containing protein [Enterococcus sp. RIT-PI-f]KPG73778.1 hypothetical protein AEQ18_00570 [Enterococcus sp. RIT-PI-f]
MKKIQTGMMNFFNITAYLAKLNLLWLLSTLLGGVIFGVGPATAVTLRYLHIFRTTGHDYESREYFQAYKKTFRQFAPLGLAILIVFSLLLLNFRIMALYFSTIAWIIPIYAVFAILLLYTLILSVITYAKSDSPSFRQAVYVSIFMVFRFPFQGLALLFSWYLLLLLLSAKTSIFLIFGVSLFLFFGEFFHHQMIVKINHLNIKRGASSEEHTSNQSL